MNVDIRITNLGEIRNAFNRSPFLMTKYLNIAIQKVIFRVGGQSRINTPVATGRLRASTYERFSNLRGEVGTNTDYDIFVHEGTRFMRPRPYLRDAIEESTNSIDDYFEDAVQKVLNEIGDHV